MATPYSRQYSSSQYAYAAKSSSPPKHTARLLPRWITCCGTPGTHIQRSRAILFSLTVNPDQTSQHAPKWSFYFDPKYRGRRAPGWAQRPALSPAGLPGAGLMVTAVSTFPTSRIVSPDSSAATGSPTPS